MVAFDIEPMTLTDLADAMAGDLDDDANDSPLLDIMAEERRPRPALAGNAKPKSKTKPKGKRP